MKYREPRFYILFQVGKVPNRIKSDSAIDTKLRLCDILKATFNNRYYMFRVQKHLISHQRYASTSSTFLGATPTLSFG